MADHSIRISIDSSGAESGATRVSRSLKQIQQDAAKAVGVGDGIKVGIDGSGAESGAARVRRSLRDIVKQALGLQSIPVGINVADAQAGAERVSRSLKDIQNQASRLTDKSIAVKLDAAALQEGVNRVLRTIRELSDQAAARAIPVNVDTSSLDAAAAKVARTMRAINEQTGSAGTEVHLNVDSSGAEQGAARVTRSLKSIQQEAARSGIAGDGIKVGIDGSNAEAGAARVRRSLRDIVKQALGLQSIPIGLDTARVQSGAGNVSRSLKDIQDQAAKLTDKSISVKISTTGVQDAVQQVSRMLQELSDQAASKPIRVKLDAESVNAAIAKASQNLKGIGGQSASVSVKVDTANAEAATEKLKRSLNDIASQSARVRFSIDPSAVEAGVSRVNRSLREISDQASRSGRIQISLDTTGVQEGANRVKKSLKDIQDEGSRTSSSMGMLAGIGTSIRGTLGSIAAAFGAVELSKEVVSVTAKFQDMETRLKTLTGSAEATGEAQSYLADTAKRLSVDMFALSDSYVKFLPLVKAGVISTDEARTTLEGLSNVAAATGASTERLKDVMYGLGQALSAPKTNAEDLNQVVEPLPGLLQALDRAAALPAGGFKEMVTEGRVTAQFFKQTLIKALAEYDGAAEKTAGNINATTTRMKNAWNSLLDTIGQTIAEPLTGLIDNITFGIAALENGIKRLSSVAGTLRDSFDWTAPIASIQNAWEKATKANPSPLQEVQGPPPPPKPAPTITATLKPKESKPGGRSGRSVGDRFAEQKQELEEQIAAQRDLVESFDRGTPAAEQYRTAIADLSDAQRLNSGFSKEQAATLAGLMQEMRGLEQMEGVKQHISSMTDEIQKIQGLADAHKEGAEAVRHVEAANKAYDEALNRGVASKQETLNIFLDLEKAVQKANAALAVAEELSKIDVDITSVQRLVDAYKEGGSAVHDAAIENEVYARSLSTGAEGEADQVNALRQKIQALHDVQDAQAQAARLQQGGFDIEQMQGEIRISQMSGEARAIETERLDMLMEKKRQLQDTTATLTDAEEEQATTMGRLNYQMQQQNTELARLARSIPDAATAFDMAASSGLGHFEDALVDIVTGAKSAREAFADMAKSIAADLARMAIRMAIIQPLAMMFGGGFGGAVAAPVFGGFMSAAEAGPISWGPQAHTGGIIGSDSLPMRALPAFHTGGVAGSETPMTRSLSSSMPPMSAWPKLHSGGLAGNEVPSILKKGEGVFTPAQMAALAPVNNNTDNRGDNVFNINVSVPSSGPGGGDPGAAERQGKIIAKQIQQAMDDHLSKNMRPGGLLNQSGY